MNVTVLPDDIAMLSGGTGSVITNINSIYRNELNIEAFASGYGSTRAAYYTFDKNILDATNLLIKEALLRFSIISIRGIINEDAQYLVYIGDFALPYGETEYSAVLEWTKSSFPVFAGYNLNPGEKNIPLSADQAKKALENGIMLTVLRPSAEGTTNSTFATFSGAPATSPRLLIEYATLDTPSRIDLLSPIATVINADANTLFQWQYEQGMGAPQAYFDLQYYTSAGWTPVYEKEPWTEQQFIVPAGTFAAGSTIYRMRTWHHGTSEDIPSEWAESTVIIRGRPAPPEIVSVTTAPRPLVEWTAPNQSGYQVMISIPAIDELVYSTGAIFSTDMAWKCPEYLEDGIYTVSLRIVNTESVWSEWATREVVITNQPGAAIRLSAAATNNYGAGLTWSTEGAYDGYHIYRNEEPIAQTTKNSYIDYFSVGKTRYTVRGLMGDYYTDSNSDTLCLAVRNAVISAVKPVNWLCLGMRRGGRPTHDIEYDIAPQYVYYEGRALPQKVSGDKMGKTHTFAMTLKTEAEYKHLESLLNTIVIYKDCMGQCVIGNLDALSPTIERVYDVDFSITETDTQEGAGDA